jgi:hypothetical protein
MSSWDVLRFICLAYLLAAFLGVIYWIAGDVLRKEGTSAVAKALWLGALVFLPLLTIVVYLVQNGSGMSARLAERDAIRAYPGYSNAYSRPPTHDLMTVRAIMT